MLKDVEHSRVPGGNDVMLSKLRERLKEKEKALEACLQLTAVILNVPLPPKVSVPRC